MKDQRTNYLLSNSELGSALHLSILAYSSSLKPSTTKKNKKEEIEIEAVDAIDGKHHEKDFKKLDKFYITTAINYTNGLPHMGHAYEGITTDVLARYHRIFGRDVFFLTGTDEHGQKVEKSALANNRSPQEHCDYYANMFKNFAKSMNLSNDHFVRTTDKFHEKFAQQLWIKVREKGDINLDTYIGWYNENEEQYVTDREVEENYELDKDGIPCDAQGRPLQKKEEESYFFNMGRYQQQLIDHINNNEDFIQPLDKKLQILKFLEKEPLNKLCISRTICQWGVPCPFDPEYKGDKKHVMYVWFDALSNYCSGIDYFDLEHKNLKQYWPANAHIIGKDIIRFHCVYWPTMLMAANIPLPKTIFAHGFVLANDGTKMSKSLGNVIDPVIMIEKFPLDSFRFYMTYEAPYGNDLPFSEETLINLHNSKLLASIGNLVNRSLNLCKAYTKGKIPPVKAYKDFPFDVEKLKQSSESLLKASGGFKIEVALRAIVSAFDETNKFLADLEPWKMKEEHLQEKKLSIVRSALEAIYILGHFFLPFCPKTCEEIFKKLNTKPSFIKLLSNNFDNLTDNHQTYVGGLLFEEYGLDGNIVKRQNAGKSSGKTQKGFNKTAAGQKTSADDWKKAKEEKKLKLLKQKEAQRKNNELNQLIKDSPDFGLIELRVGKIVKVWEHAEAERLFCEEIDIGEDKPRQIASGLREYYNLKDMQDRKVIVVCNLKPSKLAGFDSNGMVLACKDEEKNKVELIQVPKDAKVGERINLKGLDILNIPPAPANKVKKKKLFEKMAKSLLTNSKGIATWDDKELIISNGSSCFATLPNCPIR